MRSRSVLPWSFYHVWWSMCIVYSSYFVFAHFLVFCIHDIKSIVYCHSPSNFSMDGHLCIFLFLNHDLPLSENTSPPFPMDLLPWLVGWRAVWALLSKSYYVPDETWQSVEVNTFFMYCSAGIFAF